MTRKLYDLAAADRTLRFSPFCWRAKLALQHKELDFEDIDVAFTEKDKIAFSGQKLVPILADGSQVVHDSWAIACYLDETYPDAPTLMGGPLGQAHVLTIKHWVETAVHLPVLKIVLLDLVSRLAPADQDYFRESREQRFGTTLEAFCDGEAGVPVLQKALAPARMTLGLQDYLGGQTPSFADHLLLSALLWGRSSSEIKFIDDGDSPIKGWIDRLTDRYALPVKI